MMNDVPSRIVMSQYLPMIYNKFIEIKGLEFLQTQESYDIFKGIPIYVIIYIGYSLPTFATISAIDNVCSQLGLVKEKITFIDYGAGRCLWTAFLRNNGFNAIAVDYKTTRAQYEYRKFEPFIDDLNVVDSADDFSHIPEDASNHILFMSYPDHGQNPFSFKVTENFKAKGGTRILLIGNTINEAIFETSFQKEIESNWNEVVVETGMPTVYITSDFHPSSFMFLTLKMMS